jgi:hypothetical protein
MHRAVRQLRERLPKAVPIKREGLPPFLGPTRAELDQYPLPHCPAMKRLSSRQKRIVRRMMILEGFAWPWDKAIEDYAPVRRQKAIKKRYLAPLERLVKIKEAIPRRTQMLQSYAKKRRSVHKVQLNWLTLHQIVKHRMKDD